MGARWACYVSDGTNNPWSGFFIIQHDTFEVNTLFQFVQPGDEVYFTGVVDEYSGLTQLALLTNPVVPVDIISTGNPLPDPKVLTLADLVDHTNGEQWEAMLVRVENARVTNNSYTSNRAIIDDGTATGYIDDYFWYFRGRFNDGVYSWPVNGTRLNVTGFTRDINEPTFSINPRNENDLEILTNPPVISDVKRSPGVPTSSDDVTVSATITDNGTVAEAKVFYSVNSGAFNELLMTANADTFSATIPAQPNGSHVRYFVYAIDNDGDFSQVPGDTSLEVFQYVVRDGGLSVKDVQYTWGYENDASPYMGYEVTLEGVVTTDTSDWIGNYYIQDMDSAWHGIWVRDGANKPLKGDWVKITGTVEERYGVTRLNNISSFEVISSGNTFEPVQVTTGEIATGGANAEAYESVLIKVVNVTVTDPFPDAPRNYGEFVVDDGTGGVRVDDAMSAFGGNGDSSFALNDQIAELRGIHYYSYGNYKILPRDTNDVIGHVTAIGDLEHPLATTFQLEQNYPNPFNPVTTIRFTVPETAPVKLVVYNVLGQKVRTIFDEVATPGVYNLQWDGRDDNGRPLGSGIYFYRLDSKDFSKTKKMILLK